MIIIRDDKMIEKYIRDDILIITPNSYKKRILLKQKKLCNIKFMTLSELKQQLLFSYDERAIYYLMKKYHYKYDIAKMYLDNLYYIGDIQNSKIFHLKNMKEELNEEKLLLYNSHFRNYLTTKEIVFFGYMFTKFDYQLINEIKKITKVHIIEESNSQENDLIAYEFSTIEDEICFVATKIINLLKQNVSYQHIKLMNIDDSYYNTIKRIFSFYHLDISIPDSSLYSNTKVQSFLKELNQTKNWKDAFSTISKDSKIYQSLISICNRYTFTRQIDFSIIQCIEEEIKKTRIEPPQESLKIFSIDDYITPDDFVFLMNFNQNSVPKIYKDEDYLSDSIKEQLNLDTSMTLNQLEKEKVTQKLKSISNLTITYKRKTPYQEYYPSNLIKEMNIVVKKDNNEEKYLYSNLYNKIELTKKLDKMIKFNEIADDISLLYHNIKDLSYLTYNNQFTGISKQSFLKSLNHKLLLSYSSIDQYYRCSFRYYLQHILKLSKYEENFAIFIGNLFHYILSVAFLDNFDFEKEFSNYLKDYNGNYKENFFIKKLKGELKFVIETIQKQNDLSHFKQERYEERVYMNQTGNISITFMGVIDKIKYYKQNDKNYIVIIDYKTGYPETNLKNTVYGLEMQLPIYLYLANHLKQIKNVEVVGIYLQKILNKKLTRDFNKDYQQERRNQLKLEGYSVDDEEILEQFDITYKDSDMIKGLKKGSNGFYAYSKMLSRQQIVSLNRLVSKKIEEAKNNILEAKFDINPKQIGETLKGCEFCEYKELCYRKEEDIIHLKEYKDLSFLDNE